MAGSLYDPKVLRVRQDLLNMMQKAPTINGLINMTWLKCKLAHNKARHKR